MSYGDELDFALRLADVADEVSMRHFRRVQARTKDDGTLVTEGDEEVEQAIRDAIHARYPDHAILGEEQGSTNGGPGGPGAPRWIVDPIDGTNNYAWGIPVWATLIALEVSGELVLGVVSAPALGERYDAARGAGARRNGDPIHVSGVDDVREARVGHTSIQAYAAYGHAEGFDRLVAASRTTRGFGDFWGHMLVAAGSLDVMVEPVVNVWDLAALKPIVEEAGGRFTDLSGQPRVDGGNALTTNGLLHQAALRLLTG